LLFFDSLVDLLTCLNRAGVNERLLFHGTSPGEQLL
jgi:hypothetical protein